MQEREKAHAGSRWVPAAISSIVYLLSGPSLIITNKYLMETNKFHYPMALASVGLWFSFIMVLLGVYVFKVVSPTITVKRDFFVYKILPIGAAQAFTFKFGMQAYLHLSVSFIQMMKAFSPATTMTGLALLGKPALPNEVASVLTICVGTTIAAYGEINLTMIGLFCVVMAETSECARLIMTQLLLTDHKFHIVDALMYITPAGAMWLTLGSIVFEWPLMAQEGAVSIICNHYERFLAAGILGFIVNTAGYFVIQTAGAVTLKVLGTARNAGLILFCAAFLGEVITSMEGMGYALALSAFTYYTYLQMTKNSTAKVAKERNEAIEDLESNISSRPTTPG